MALPSRGEPAADTTPDANARMGAELDLQTALSLARAATVALLNLSPLSHREIVAALTDELTHLKARDDARAATVADLLAQYLPDAA